MAPNFTERVHVRVITWNNDGSSMGGTSITVSLGLHLGIPVQTDTASSEEQACSAPDTEGTGK